VVGPGAFGRVADRRSARDERRDEVGKTDDERDEHEDDRQPDGDEDHRGRSTAPLESDPAEVADLALGRVKWMAEG
jgi:hypothetical protein